jgi:hypothetical protein
MDNPVEPDFLNPFPRQDFLLPSSTSDSTGNINHSVSRTSTPSEPLESDGSGQLFSRSNSLSSGSRLRLHSRPSSSGSLSLRIPDSVSWHSSSRTILPSRFGSSHAGFPLDDNFGEPLSATSSVSYLQEMEEKLHYFEARCGYLTEQNISLVAENETMK